MLGVMPVGALGARGRRSQLLRTTRIADWVTGST